MISKDEGYVSGLDRLNALLAWWGIPAANGNDEIIGQMKHLQVFISDLRKSYSEAHKRQLNALYLLNDQIAELQQGLLHCNKPRDVITAESNVLQTIRDGASVQAMTWLELTQKVQDCCAAMAREAAELASDQRPSDTETEPVTRTQQSSAIDKRQAYE